MFQNQNVVLVFLYDECIYEGNDRQQRAATQSLLKKGGLSHYNPCNDFTDYKAQSSFF